MNTRIHTEHNPEQPPPSATILFPSVQEASDGLLAVPETVKTLRLREGYTLAGISAQVGKKSSWASKIESGQLQLQGKDLESYAEVLDVPAKLLTIELPSVDAEGMMFRRYRTPKRTVHQLEGEASLRLHIVQKLLGITNYDFKTTFEQYNAKTDEEVRQAAMQTRARWGIDADKAVADLPGYMERDGIILTSMPLSVDRVNAATYWRDQSTPPLVMLSPATIDNTKRFTLAHELGHLVLDRFSPHPDDPKLIESRADLFAGELLAPYSLVRESFLSLTPRNIDGLIELGRYWGMHPKSFVTRAALFGDISKDQATSWYKKLNGSIRHYIEAEESAYPVSFKTLRNLANRLQGYGWNMASLLELTSVRRRDIEAVIGVDNLISAGTGRPSLKVI